MEASCVRGILPARESAPVETAGRWLIGFATLSGRNFPVIDLRAKLGLPLGTHGRHPYIVAVEVKTCDGPRLAGFIADGVSELVQARERDFHLGKLRLGGRPRLVLNPESLFSAEVTL